MAKTAAFPNNGLHNIIPYYATTAQKKTHTHKKTPLRDTFHG